MSHSPQSYFYLLQIGLGILFLGIGYLFFRPDRPESGFRVREADRDPKFFKSQSALASAKLKTEPEKKGPLRLTGIRLDGPPHEILGVRMDAGPEEVQKAYRELMKRYHPDKMGPQGSREWNDAQKIAEAIIRAKDTLLKKRS